MKNFWKMVGATICGILILSLLSSIFSFAILGLVMAGSESETVLKPHSVYRIDMSGEVVEQAASDDFEAAFAEALGRSADGQYALSDIVRNIRLAKENENIDGIYLKGGNLAAGFANSQVIRRALLDFKQSGKFIVAYADNYGQANYWIASVADKVYVNVDGGINWSGLYSQLMFYSRALEKLGVEMQVVKVGTFKSAVEPYILRKMSEPNRLQMNTMLQDFWGVVTADVAASRNLSVERLQELADMNMAFQPQEMLVETGLADSLAYASDMKAVLEQLTGTDKFELVSNSKMNKVPNTDKYEKDRIAIIYAEGQITDDSGDGIVGKDMVKTINKVAEKDNVKAVVLRVNSPGGSAFASEQIWDALRRLKEKKPLVVSMGNYAASGGYYISCIGDSIFAEENTLTGSIGIFGLIPNVAKLTDKLGLDFDEVKTNKMSSMEANLMSKGMNSEERALMQGMINRGYELFVSRCADGRSMTTDEIKAIAEGRVWSGKRALEIGLVDKIGDTDDAIKAAAALAELDKYKVVTFPEKKDRFTRLVESLSNTTDEEKMLIKYVREIEQLSQKPSLQARLPYYITIQ